MNCLKDISLLYTFAILFALLYDASFADVKLKERVPYVEELSDRLNWTSQESDYLYTEKPNAIYGNTDDSNDNKKPSKVSSQIISKDDFSKVNLKLFTDFCTAIMNLKDRQFQLKIPKTYSNVTARHRRHRYNMIVTMIFGVVTLGAILVPMGFQLLSVISGKALLLAKMALLLASINGLKRVANSGVHYGLYQVPNEPYYDRGNVYLPRDYPHSVNSPTPSYL